MNQARADHLPRPTRDLDQARRDLDQHGYCVLADALEGARVSTLRARLEDQALAERQAGIAYLDGAPGQNWGSFRDADGKLRTGAFAAGGGGINQRVWMLINKGRAFVDLLAHGEIRQLVGHVMGEHYLLSSFTANIANPGGVPMKLHTDQWWMPAPTRRDRMPLPIGSMRRDRFDRDERVAASAEAPPMIAPAACANVMWMLVDFTEENGATRIVPGSHRSGRQPDPVRDRDVASLPAEAPSGSAMVFDGRLWHGTGANTGTDQRLGILTTFCGPQFRPQENFTVGTRPEVLRTASSDLRRLLGFGIWSGYGRTDSPVAEFLDPDAPLVGELQSTEPAATEHRLGVPAT